MTIVGTNPDAVIGGVDTHVDMHVAAAVNHVGGVLGVEAFPTTQTGYRRLVGWLVPMVSSPWWEWRAPAHTVSAWPAIWPGPVCGWWRWIVPTAKSGIERASPTRWMRWRRLERPCRERYRVTQEPGWQRGSDPSVDDRSSFRGRYSD